MNSLVAIQSRIPPSSESALSKAFLLQEHLLKLPQEDITTHHVLHGGAYVRTIKIRKNIVLTGALIKVPTTLIVDGDVSVYLDDEAKRLTGFHVLAASAHRKQAFIAHEDTMLTMIFATDAKNIEQAEAQFTDEHESLLSRHPHSINEIIITGE